MVKKMEKTQGIRRYRTLLLAVLGASVVVTTACSNAKGTDMAPREDILKSLRADGFLFNKHVISTLYGENQNQVVVTGQLAQKTPDNTHVANGLKVTQLRKLVVENVNGAWKVISTSPVEREQLSSRQRW